MSIEAPSAPVTQTQAGSPKKVNLRRPDIMEAVQAQVLSHYRSELVDRIRQEIAQGTYETEDRLDQAIENLAEDLDSQS